MPSNQYPILPDPLHCSCYSSPLVKINIGLLADDVGVSTTDTLDLGQGVHRLALSINVGVEETENVVEDL